MPDSPRASASGAARIAGLALAVAGAVGLAASAFVTWYRVTAPLPDIARLGGLPSEIEARINGFGSVTVPAYGNLDVSSSVPNDVAWGGWAAIALAVVAVAGAAAAAFGPATWRAVGAWGALACGVLGAALGLYAQLVPVGAQPVSVGGFTVQVDTAASVGPPLVWIAALPLLLGAVLLDRARRSAPATVAPPVPPAQPVQSAPRRPAPPFAPAPQRPGAPQSNPGWARPVPPAPVPEEQIRTAVAPVAQRRPRPDWDRNWPGAVPTKPGPRTPSEQHTQVVKRPPRPVRVSPKPETEAIPRRDPRYDSPTQP
ncbi:hypothetical protein FK529_12710 [Tsukamurella asaccharolytica]|uniref:Uncharacterized protein n=1 Tax=Tsukamurella asaccharolytica TaxID=2592067 RepID=A0A5C5R927_9ACTN|nr:hypothetical protein [Tsukamurella asaccharolytica]TWS18843.1 hypothetical protein FK529_12710 [Tsukamurella asaccharolytica]